MKILFLFIYGTALLLTAIPITVPGQETGTYIIDTAAGSGEKGFDGDNGLAVKAKLFRPTAVDVDKAGNLFIVDNGNNCIRKVDSNGIITTFAGTGKPGLSGDGGPAVQAQFNSPYGIRVDPGGNVLVADQGNNRIRKITPDGIIKTVAGNGKSEFSGDGGLAIDASLSNPDDVLVDETGSMYIADGGNHRVRKVTPDGIIKTIAGTGKLRYNGESGYSGDGSQAVAARLNFPSLLAADNAGNLYIGDFFNHAIRKITPEGIIYTVAGTGKRGFNGDNISARNAQLNEPGGIAIAPDGSLLIADGLNFRIRRIKNDGSIQTIAGTGKRGFSGDGGPALNADLSVVDMIKIDLKGSIYFADVSNNRIRRLTYINDKPTPLKESPGTSANQKSEPQKLLELIQKAYEGVQTAKLSYTFRRGELDKNQVSPKGTIEFAAPGKMHAELDMPGYGTVFVYCDGQKITTIDPSEELPDIRNFDNDTLTQMVPGDLEITGIYDWKQQFFTGENSSILKNKLRIIENEKWGEGSWTVLERISERRGTLTRYYIDPKTNLIRRTLVKSLINDEMIYDGWITGLKINTKINEKRFKAP